MGDHSEISEFEAQAEKLYKPPGGSHIYTAMKKIIQMIDLSPREEVILNQLSFIVNFKCAQLHFVAAVIYLLTLVLCRTYYDTYHFPLISKAYPINK